VLPPPEAFRAEGDGLGAGPARRSSSPKHPGTEEAFLKESQDSIKAEHFAVGTDNYVAAVANGHET
jgi:hypothetical protein